MHRTSSAHNACEKRIAVVHSIPTLASIHSEHTFLISIAILGKIFGFERSRNLPLGDGGSHPELVFRIRL